MTFQIAGAVGAVSIELIVWCLNDFRARFERVRAMGIDVLPIRQLDMDRLGVLAGDVFRAESISKTARSMWAEGRKLNLERALKVGDELGGHIVTGHVDAVGEVVSIETEGDSHPVRIHAPAAIAAYLAPKGSITVDGISLTVNTVEDQADGSTIFGLNIIPHTASVTTFADLKTGDQVNLEIDILARYLSRMEQLRPAKA